MAGKTQSKTLSTAYRLLIQYQNDLEDLKKELGILEKEIVKTERKIAKYGKESDIKRYDELAKLALDTQEKISKKTIAVNRQTNKIIENDARKSLRNVENIQKRWNERKRRMAAATEKKIAADRIAQQKRGVSGYVSRWKRAFDTVTRYLSSAALIGIGLQGVRDVATDFLEIEKTLTKVAVITGTTISESNKLRDTVYGVASSYAIAAKEVAGFVFSMSKLGKSQEDIEKLANSAASLATILGEDMNRSGTTLVTTMNQFNLTTSQASDVAGTFFRAIKESPLAINDLQIALQHAGTAADAAGLSIKQTGAIIQYLSNRGLRASKIGTGLRNVILKLSGNGQDLKETLDELSKSGVTLSEAMTLFTKRGALAGYTIVNNWDEVKDLFNYELPTAIEQTQSTLMGTTSTMDRFAKLWSSIKGFVFGSKEDKDVELINKINDDLNILGVTMTNLGEKVREGVKEGGVTDWIDYLFGDNKKVQNKIRNEGSTLNNLSKDLNNLIKEFAKRMQAQIGKRSDIQSAIDSFNDKVSQIRYIVLRGFNKDEALKVIETYKDDFVDALKKAGVDVTEAEKKWNKELITQQTRIKNTVPFFNKQQLLDRINATKAEIKQIQDSFDAGNKNNEDRDRLDQLLKDEKEWCAKAVKWGMPLACKEVRKKLKNNLSENLAALRAEYRKALAGFEKENAQVRFNKTTVSNNLMDGFRELLSLKEFKAQIEGADTKKSQKEVIDDYKNYMNDFLDKLLQSTDKIETDNIQDLATYYGNQKKSTNFFISILKNMLSDAKSEDDKKKINKEILYFQTQLDVIDTKLINGVKKTTDSANEAKKKIKAKRTSLLDLFQNLISTDGKKDIKKILRQVSEALQTISQAYAQFANEIEQQTQDRLDREKQSIQNRYDFEKDQLRLAAENNLVTQEQYGQRSLALEKSRLKKTNEIERKQFEAKKKTDEQVAIVQGVAQTAEAFITAYLNMGATPAAIPFAVISAALVAAESAVKIAAIGKREFTPVTFAEGGIVDGASHKDGGVPFTVAGRGGYEMEGGEYIINKYSVTPQTIPILDSINNDRKYNSRYFSYGGQVPDVSEGKQSASSRQNNQTIIRANISYKDLDAYMRNKENRDEKTNLLS